MECLGERIKALRQERDLTMDMLVADLKRMFPNIKIEKSMLSRWESGENSPTLENAKNLSIYFNVSLDYLIGLTDVRTPSRLLAMRIGIEPRSVSKIIEVKPNETGKDPSHAPKAILCTKGGIKTPTVPKELLTKFHKS